MLPGRTYTAVDFVEMARRRSWLMIGGLVLGAYAALVVSSQLEDKFQSEMLIQVIPQRVPDSYVQSTVTMRTEDRLNALSQQVLSRTALEGLINELNLYQRQRARLPMQDVVELMRADVNVNPVISTVGMNRETEAFYVRFTYTDRDIATRVTERLGGLFIDLNAKDRGQLAVATNEFLESQLAETRKELEAQERKLEDFRLRNAGRLPTQVDSNMQVIQSTQLSIQALVESLARDRDRKLMLERLYHDAEIELHARPVTPPVQVASDKPAEGSIIAPLPPEQQLAAAKEGLARMLLRLKPEHPDVVRARRIIADLEARVAHDASVSQPSSASPAVRPAPLSPELAARHERQRQTRAEIDSLERQIEFKEGEERRLRETLAAYQRRLEEVPGVESEWIALTRDYKTQQASYESLLAKSEQSKVAVELERRQIGEQFRVLDPARPPVRPTGVNRLQVNAMGAIAGLMLGVVLAALLEFRDSTFRTAQDVHEVLQLPIVARVPYVMLDLDRWRQRRVRIATSLAVVMIAVAGAYGFWALQLWKFVGLTER
jgi:polysaccharide chain length determinant protein (PEP-CTERM system associated)